jgi:two-component system sensor histidine kinase AlgZ
MRSSRAYWTCQALGWGSFTLYVLSGYVATVGWTRMQAADIANIVFFDAVLCPLFSDGLRRWMKSHGWLTLPARRLAPRLLLVVLLFGAVISGLVLVFLAVIHAGQTMSTGSAIGMFFAFSIALSGWLTIYFQALARRRQATLERQALELSLVARDAQLRALRSQVNPHFLFNSLNSVRGLIVEDPARAAAMVTGFAGLMRYSLGSDRRETVTLAEEIEAVDDYLGLERVRFEERLRVERALTPEAMDARIPPMMVQALVENAIKHGIAALRDGGVVRIDAQVAGRELWIRVSNTGTLGAQPGGAGVGLANAHERLRLLYGAAASLTLDQRDGPTVVACLIVPIAEATA